MNMDENEWLISQDPMPMLAALRGKARRGKASSRKLRLFACGCSHFVNISCLGSNNQICQIIEVAEGFADALVSPSELEAARNVVAVALAGEHGTKKRSALFVIEAATRTDWSEEVVAIHAARGAYSSGERKLVGMERRSKEARERQKAARLAVKADKRKVAAFLRDLFRNPFRGSATIDQRVLTSETFNLGKLIYETRDFSRLPELAELLESNGCLDVELLSHLRGPGTHVKGCWALDLVLGKS